MSIIFCWTAFKPVVVWHCDKTESISFFAPS